MTNETLTITGQVSIELLDEDGNLKQKRSFKNLVVDTGKAFIMDRMVNNSTTMNFMAVGTSLTAPSAGQTTLVAEVASSRVAAVGSPSLNTCTYNSTFGPGVGTGALNEAGIFTTNPAGIMLCRSLFPSTINKAAGDTLNVTWLLTLT